MTTTVKAPMAEGKRSLAPAKAKAQAQAQPKGATRTGAAKTKTKGKTKAKAKAKAKAPVKEKLPPRVHKSVLSFNDLEMNVINQYCERFNVRSRAKLFREAILATLLRRIEENHPTLF